MGHSYKRSKRVGEQLMREVSNMISSGEIKDPRISSVVITNFYLSDDMGYLRLYYALLSENTENKTVEEGLQIASGFIRKKIGDKLRLKKLPKIEFEFDKVLENGYKVDDLIREVKGE
ncbi:MAG: 30S ribosome-binding factor RbfA [Thermodesulfobacteriota bacterium]